MEEKILNALDNTHDGILTLGILRQKNIRFTNEVCNAIHNLINRGVLKERDCEDFAVERVDNTKSCYGEQKFFNEYIHLTKVQLIEEIAKWNKEAHGLVIHIMDDIGCCINSKCISCKEDGIQYFNNTYDGRYRYEFIILQ